MSDTVVTNSINLMQRAKAVIPGGVNSPVRAFKAVGGHPRFFQRGEGAYMYDVDQNCYIDYVGSWGPLILGHAHPQVIAAVKAAAQQGLSFGAPSPAEVEMAELITHLMPSMELVRMTSSGTEATMCAIRLARGFTGRKKILKFDSCYHGHSDSLLVKSGSGILTLGIAGSAGVIEVTAEQTLVVPYNDLAAVQQMFAAYGNDIAAIIVEPIAANNNVIMPAAEFLPGLRAICDQYNSVLIFDEVITGFRVALGGAQEIYSINADITCLGKIIGGGLPVGAFGGRKEILEMLAPLGPVYQAGTLSGNPVTMAAGIATLKVLQNTPNIYQQLHHASTQVTASFTAAAKDNGIQLQSTCLNGLFGFAFVNDPQNQMFNKFFQLMLQHGVYLAPSAFEAGFVSTAHDAAVLAETAVAAQQCFAALQLAEA
ncbi:MAG TPA: glutamate-1-semialdehyde 2,1-aminomutase [Gammaproteobacteria bacterium]|nr:glutamate-1-semialdehyde 2,1-aminomutase [Gammaproteobacteria bacterium]